MPDDEETVVWGRLSRLLSLTAPGPVPMAPDLSAVNRPDLSAVNRPDLSAVNRPGPLAASSPGMPRSGVPGGAHRRGTRPPDPPPASAPPVAGSGGLPGPHAFDPGRRGVRVLAVVAVLVALVAAGWAWHARPRTEPVATDPPAIAADQGGAVGSAEPAPADSVSANEVVVAVAGKVRRPGLVRLPPGSRVADALTAAGGALPGVDIALLNPARKVTDGELILVGVTAPPGVGQPAGVPGVAGPAGGDGGPAGSGKVNLNTATLAELDALPGVGPVLAQRIVDHRTDRGAFRSVSDLRQVNGIGEARYEDLKDLVTV
nr:ComEA family DNA-binding protein [Micromonospora sp. DSM 115978]